MAGAVSIVTVLIRLGVLSLQDLASTPQGVAEGPRVAAAHERVRRRPARDPIRPRLHGRRARGVRDRRRAHPLGGGNRRPPACDRRRVRGARRGRRHGDAAGLRDVGHHRCLDRRHRVRRLAAGTRTRRSRALRRRRRSSGGSSGPTSTFSTPSTRSRSRSGSGRGVAAAATTRAAAAPLHVPLARRLLPIHDGLLRAWRSSPRRSSRQRRRARAELLRPERRAGVAEEALARDVPDPDLREAGCEDVLAVPARVQPRGHDLPRRPVRAGAPCDVLADLEARRALRRSAEKTESNGLPHGSWLNTPHETSAPSFAFAGRAECRVQLQRLETRLRARVIRQARHHEARRAGSRFNCSSAVPHVPDGASIAAYGSSAAAAPPANTKRAQREAKASRRRTFRSRWL